MPIIWQDMWSTKQQAQEKALLYTAGDGTVAAVRSYLNDGANIECRDDDGATPLHKAAVNGHLNVVSALLENGARLKAKTKQGWTPLHSAACYGQVDVARFLLEKGAKIDARDKSLETPLHLAARRNQVEVVGLLLARGAHLNARNKNNHSPLMAACEKGHVQVQELLRQHPDAIPEGGPTRPQIACMLAVVCLLGVASTRHMLDPADDQLGVGADRYSPKNDPLPLADTGLGDWSTATAPLSLAPETRQVEARASLAQAQDDAYDPSDAPTRLETVRPVQGLEGQVRAAARDGQLDVLQSLLRKHPTIQIDAHNEDGKTALHLAVERGHVEIVAVLLEPTALTGDTSLQLAARLGNAGHVETLLKAFLSKHTPAALAPMLAAALFDAMMHKHEDVVQMLQPLVSASRPHLASLSDDPATVAYLAALAGDTSRPEPRSADLHTSAVLATTILLFLLAAARQWYMVLKNQTTLSPTIAAPAPTQSATEAALLDAIDATDWALATSLLFTGAPVPTHDDSLSALVDHVLQAFDADLLRGLLSSLHANGDPRASDICRKALLAAVTTDKPRLLVAVLHDPKTAAMACVVSQTNTSPLHEAAARGCIGILSLLLVSPSVDVNTANEDGYTPLALAAERGHCDVIRALVSVGADVAIPLPNGSLLLDAAVANVDTSVLAALLTSPSLDLNAKDKAGNSILARAVVTGATFAVERLLGADASASISAPDGSSLLALANQRGRRRIARLLYKSLYDAPHEATNTDIDRAGHQFLGEGGGGAVVKASYRGCSVAIKATKNGYRSQSNALRLEIEEMRQFGSPYVLPLLAAVDASSNNPQMILELMTNGDLYKYLEDTQANAPVSMVITPLDVAWVLANALWDLHQGGRMHRDVKSHNIFLCAVHGIKLGDLGKMCAWNDSLTTNAGTPKWRAPEVGVSGSNYDYAADVYSVGVVLDELCVLASNEHDAPWLAPMATACKQETPTSRPTAIAIVERLGYEVHNITVPNGLELHLVSSRQVQASDMVCASCNSVTPVLYSVACIECHQATPDILDRLQFVLARCVALDVDTSMACVTCHRLHDTTANCSFCDAPVASADAALAILVHRLDQALAWDKAATISTGLAVISEEPHTTTSA
ncbi:serine/threonine protein kinase [Saprolegnia diclina VS20]|uniref:Serine/threonine protein kinase n=1 Tax=Saprolegnia diclina (strain VS20) TaxID=1156394 RepID=T0PMM6_SAPDV|nr:serine/threonine protein kinase [Saprolegnia diclina VS20]EQC26669.1 serine/threonine protein kinase [Saprolegnia diclina VS20]|eukprot:XP_008619904.1 serine/threonine protein kinase [Saprolegnia diclina VS20]